MNETTPPPSTPQLPPPTASQAPQLAPPAKKSRLKSVSIIAILIFAIVAGVGIATRADEARHLKKKTQEAAVPTVATMTVKTGAPTEDVTLPGTVEAWHEAIIYARTGGYIKSWNADIGAKVKEGDVLAEIDAPDLDAQLHQAQANLGTAEANNKLAQITAQRWIELRKSDSVSQQDVDTKVAAADADKAAVDAAKATVDQLQQEENFKTITAPFDGTITARNTDVGALVIASSNGAGQDMFHIAETDKLRVYVQIPETYAGHVAQGMKAELHFPEHPHDIAQATLDRTADALDPTTRTLMTEFEVDNSDGKILSGSYTDVHLQVPTSHLTVIVPVNTLLFRDGMQIGVLGEDGRHVALKKVVLGRDYGKTVEIVSGIAAGDTIVINPPDSMVDGEEVKPVAQQEQEDPQAKAKDTSKVTTTEQAKQAEQQTGDSATEGQSDDKTKDKNSSDDQSGK